MFLRRRDLLGQALSWARAAQTGAFRAAAPVVHAPAYDAELIADRLRRTAVEETRWRMFFARNGLAPLELTYEDLVADPAAAVASVADLMGLERRPTPDPGQVDVRVQRDALTDAWRERFLRERRDLGFVDAL